MTMFDCGSIPTIEVGSFVAPQPDKSEFIGSASGAFFVNTVFRAFATVAGSTTTTTTTTTTTNSGTSTGMDAAGAVHNSVVAAPDDDACDANNPHHSSSSMDDAVVADDDVQARGYDYSIAAAAASGLGIAPDPDTAKKLLMIYFKNWHPFFPFLHGPSFLDQINAFYEEEINAKSSSTNNMSQHALTCRAIIFQCVFNLASSSSSQPTLLASHSRIQSTLALTTLLGSISSTNDILSLQALLAMELFLASRMSLRPASTVHGMLTRMLYHAGFHRCPHRYVQLSRGMCDVRQRLFWSVYVLDRYLSQALGHPVSIRDDEVDVCVPGMAELHRPVKPRDISVGGEGGDERRYDGRANEGNDDLGDYILGNIVSHAHLVGRTLNLFHRSIHKRDITWDKVLNLTSSTHSWWNSLPSNLQEGGKSRYSPLFSILYNWLILLINRPFLSLPTNKAEFRTSLQAAVAASRALIGRVNGLRGSLVLSWPGALSAIWMAGLVVAFAGLLGMYPLDKAILDLDCCIELLDIMTTRWISAKHCRQGLEMLLDRLKTGSSLDPNMSLPQPVPVATATSSNTPTSTPDVLPPPAVTLVGAKRKTFHHTSPTGPLESRRMSEFRGMSNTPTTTTVLPQPTSSSSSYLWQPVLEYTGPDFGFDSGVAQGQQDGWEGYRLSQQGLSDGSGGGDFGAGGLYSDDMWEAYVQGIGSHLNFF